MTGPDSRQPRRIWTAIALSAAWLVACAVCGGGPILALLWVAGGFGAVSKVPTIWVPVLEVLAGVLVVLVVTTALAWFVVRRKRRTEGRIADPAERHSATPLAPNRNRTRLGTQATPAPG